MEKVVLQHNALILKNKIFKKIFMLSIFFFKFLGDFSILDIFKNVHF